MTLIVKPDLDIVAMNLYNQDEVSNFSGSRVTAQTDIQTDLTKIITS